MSSEADAVEFSHQLPDPADYQEDFVGFVAAAWGWSRSSVEADLPRYVRDVEGRRMQRQKPVDPKLAVEFRRMITYWTRYRSRRAQLESLIAQHQREIDQLLGELGKVVD